MKTIRIGCGQGFWGDSLEAPLNLVRQGPLDYLILDYLAEVTMSVLVRQKQKHPEAGYARDFVDLCERLLPEILKRDVKVLANAGGVNPQACAKAVLAVGKKLGLSNKLKIAVVEGDNLFDRVTELRAAGESFSHLETAADFSTVENELRSANVYIGADSLVQALAGGANMVICGRVADPCLALAPMVHEFGWAWDDWNRLAAGVVAGHLIECGAQCSGGNCSADWESIPELETIGYPIVEMSEAGSFRVCKHPGTGGRIDLRSVKEQLVYEIGDPGAYLTPDVSADFASLSLKADGDNRVSVSGVKGRARPEKLKVSMSVFAGYSASGTLIYSWPQAAKKAKKAAEIVKARLEDLGLFFPRVRTEIIGVNACHGSMAETQNTDLAEAVLRVAVSSSSAKDVERFTREIAPLVLNGPPSATGYFGSRGKVEEMIGYWPTLIRRSEVNPEVTFVSEAK